VEAVAPYGGVYTVRNDTQTHALGEMVTQAVFVRPLAQDAVSEATSSTARGGEQV
jgi:hypothetical protein